MVKYSKLAPSKKITDAYTLRKQIGSNVFKRQPQSNFQYGNFMSEYYKNQSYYYYRNEQSPYISQSSSGGGAGGSGGGYADESSGVPPWIQNPNKSETEQAWNIVRAEMAERFGNLKNWIQNANENGFKSENAYGITMKDITTLIPETHQELFINSLNILKDPSSSYTDKQTALNSLTFVVGVAEKDLGNNVAFTDPQTGISYTWNDYLGNPGDQASWKMHSGDLDYTIYMLLNTPYLVTDKYDRSVLEATLTDIHNGNPFSIQQGNATIDVLDRVLTPENMIKVEEQKFYAGALQELKDMDTSGMNKYQYAQWESAINKIENKQFLNNTDISYVKEQVPSLGDFYDSVKTVETAVNNNADRIASNVSDDEQKKGVPKDEADKKGQAAAEAAVGGLPFITSIINLFNKEVNPLMQLPGGTDVTSQQYNPAFYQGYTSQFYKTVPGETPLEKTQYLGEQGIKDYNATREDTSLKGLFANQILNASDPYARTLYGVNISGQKELPTVGDYLQLGLTLLDIVTIGMASKADSAVKATSVADDAGKGGFLRNFFSKFSKSESDDVATRLAHLDEYGNYIPAQGGRVGQTVKDGRKIIEDLGDNVRVRNLDGSHSVVSAKNIPEVKIPGKTFNPNTNYIDKNGRPLKELNILYGDADEAAKAAYTAQQTTQTTSKTGGLRLPGLSIPASGGGIKGDLGMLYNFAKQHPVLTGIGALVAGSEFVERVIFANFNVGDTLQQKEQYSVKSVTKDATPNQYASAMAINKSAVRFQEGVAYTQAKVNERLLGTPLIGNVVSLADTFIFSHGLSRGIQQSHAYDEVMRENFEHLKARGLVTGEGWQNATYRTAEQWMDWYKTEGRLIHPKSDVGYEITQVYKMLNDPKFGSGYRADWNKIMNEDIKDFNAPIGKGQGVGTGFGVLQPKTGIIPVAGQTQLQDVKPGQMSESQRILSDVLNKATDISQVKQVADKFGLNIEGQMKFTTDKSLEGYKNAVLTVARDNENSPFTIDRRDKTVYAPPVTTQNRENYFTKVQQPQTIYSKYVPQAATYGGNQAVYQQQPSVSYDPSLSINVGDTERPWLGTGQDVFSWSNNLPITSQADYNAMVQQEQDRIQDAFFTPTVIDQTWGFAQLIAEINYNPIDNLKKDKKR